MKPVYTNALIIASVGILQFGMAHAQTGQHTI